MGKKDKEEKAQKKVNSKSYLHLILIGILLVSAVFFSTAVILYIGLIPTFVAFFTDRSKGKGKAVTVGSYNLIGCMPFLIELWSVDDGLNKSLSIILDPMTLVLIYTAAGFGCVIDWVATSLASNVLHRKGVLRQEAIIKRKKHLEKRWGDGVKG
jgi:hypothetical protein